MAEEISLNLDTMTPLMLDITAPVHVEVSIRADGEVLWVNIDGICRLRCCQIANLIVTDARKEK